MDKVLLLNGSPHEKGCTYRALKEVADALASYGVEAEIFHIGSGPIQGCTGCRACKKLGICVHNDDIYKQAREKMAAADGIVIGTPVYFASPNGTLIALLDRLFYSASDLFKGKPAAAVVSCRVRGAVAAFHSINAYFESSQMPVVPSQYWNVVHGVVAEDVENDRDGLMIMRVLAKNMNWMLKTIRDSGAAFDDGIQLRY